MSAELGGIVWVFHAGALGDQVMTWPLVRAMARGGASVTMVAAASHAALCEREVGRLVGGGGSVRGVSAEQGRFTRMWGGEVREGDVVEGVSAVVSFVADEESDAGRTWWGVARRMFPGAEMVWAGGPGSASRGALWRRARVDERGGVEMVENVDGPVVLFAGAGGEAKRWEMARWVELAMRVRRTGASVELIAGPVEAEGLGARERAMFEEAGGRWVGGRGVEELAGVIQRARVYVGCDTGPTHLAAQLGVRTVALFGPTDARVWGPVGARVRIVAPSSAGSMSWLGVERAMVEIERLRE